MSQYGSLYLPLATCEVPEGNDRRVKITVKDQYGNLVDISGALEISFAVWDMAGGTLQFQKTLTGGDIAINGNSASFSFNIEDTDTTSRRLCYFEAQVTASDGRKATILAGQYRAENTYTGDIA